MEEFRGTKGEWLVDDIDVISRETGMAICQVYDGSDNHISEMDMEVVNANARLVAAAPELLKACQEALQYVCVEEPAYDVLCDAIKKATE